MQPDLQVPVRGRPVERGVATFIARRQGRGFARTGYGANQFHINGHGGILSMLGALPSSAQHPHAAPSAVHRHEPLDDESYRYHHCLCSGRLDTTQVSCDMA